MSLPRPVTSHPTPTYQRHQPEKTLLYRLIQENLLSFYNHMDGTYEGGLPSFVKREFDEFLRCGILAHGFLRVRCVSCHHEKLVAFICKRRGFCPSCGVKRMVESAAHLVDEVFPPHKPLRQWVLSFPFHLRLLFAKAPTVMSAALGIVYRIISTHLIKKAGLTKKSGAKTGAVTFIERFGGSLNLNIHFHIMYLDGVYTFPNGKAQFHATPTPTPSELNHLVSTISHRVVKMLEKKGLIVKDEMGQGFLSTEPMGAMDEIQASSVTYRVALGKTRAKKSSHFTNSPQHPVKVRSYWLVTQDLASMPGWLVEEMTEKNSNASVDTFQDPASVNNDSLSTPKVKLSINSKHPMTMGPPILSWNP